MSWSSCILNKRIFSSWRRTSVIWYRERNRKSSIQTKVIRFEFFSAKNLYVHHSFSFFFGLCLCTCPPCMLFLFYLFSAPHFIQSFSFFHSLFLLIELFPMALDSSTLAYLTPCHFFWLLYLLFCPRLNRHSISLLSLSIAGIDANDLNDNVIAK